MEQSLENVHDLIKVYDHNNETWKFVKRDKAFVKELMTIEDALSRFGLLKNEIRVYVYLARAGEKKAAEIAEAISLHRTETYRILRDLEKKGIVFSAFEKPLKFTAVSLEKAIDLLIKAQKVKIVLLEREKDGLVKLWSTMPQPKVENNKKDIFQILEGEQQVILKSDEILRRTENEIKIFAPSQYMAQLYHSEFTDNLERFSKKLKVTLLTDNSLKSRFFLEKLKLANHKCRVVDAKNLPCFIVSDSKELLIVIQKGAQEKDNLGKKKPKVVALWTNYNAFVETLEMLFSKLDETRRTVQEIYVRTPR
jgi:sugar-specific transcriptional regulator TrmB